MDKESESRAPAAPTKTSGDPGAGSQPEPTDRVPYPTHHLEDTKLDERAVQFLVTTQNHLYDTRRSELRKDTWQTAGTMSDASIQALTKVLGNRVGTTDLQAGAASSTQPKFQGPGHVINEGVRRGQS